MHLLVVVITKKAIHSDDLAISAFSTPAPSSVTGASKSKGVLGNNRRRRRRNRFRYRCRLSGRNNASRAPAATATGLAVASTLVAPFSALRSSLADGRSTGAGRTPVAETTQSRRSRYRCRLRGRNNATRAPAATATGSAVASTLVTPFSALRSSLADRRCTSAGRTPVAETTCGEVASMLLVVFSIKLLVAKVGCVDRVEGRRNEKD
jgi:hypothetical protein